MIFPIIPPLASGNKHEHEHEHVCTCSEGAKYSNALSIWPELAWPKWPNSRCRTHWPKSRDPTRGWVQFSSVQCDLFPNACRRHCWEYPAASMRDTLWDRQKYMQKYIQYTTYHSQHNTACGVNIAHNNSRRTYTVLLIQQPQTTNYYPFLSNISFEARYYITLWARRVHAGSLSAVQTKLWLNTLIDNIVHEFT
jgi:hypothetical protein